MNALSVIVRRRLFFLKSDAALWSDWVVTLPDFRAVPAQRAAALLPAKVA